MTKVLLLLIGCAQLAWAQGDKKYFEGLVQYRVQLAGLGADWVRGWVPQAQTMTYVGGRAVMRTMGGSLPQHIVFDGRQHYQLNDESKTYKRVANPDLQPEVAVQAGADTMIAGYACRKYSVRIQARDQVVQQWVWACAALPRGAGETPLFYHYDAIPGMPLQVQLPIQLGLGMQFTLTLTATQVQASPVPVDAVRLPTDYQASE